MKLIPTCNAAKLARVGFLLFATSALCGTLTGLTGCGGGSSAGTTTPGRFAVTVNWPAPSRLIPAASGSIDAVLSSGEKTLGHKLLVKPTAAPWTTTVTFDNLKPGAVTLATTAYPNADGTGVAQAKGTMNATIKSGAQTSATVDMNATIDHLAVTPASPTVAVGASIPLTATAFNAQGGIVLTSAQSLSWNSAQSAKATVTTAGSLTGVAAGTSVITVTDAETGKSATTTVTVTGGVPAPVTGPLRSIVDRTGKFAYVINSKSNSISPFTINADGTLTPLGAAPVALGKAPSVLTINPVGGSHTLYVAAADATSALLYQFNINADGTLTPLGSGSVASTSGPLDMVVDPAGKYLYEIDHNNGIRAFLIGVDGSLTQNGPDLADGDHQLFAAAIAPDGKALYASAGQGGGIRIDKINSDGTLSHQGSVNDFANGMTIDATGGHLYLDTDTGVNVYKIASDDSLTKVGNGVTISSDTLRSAITPNGKYLYVVAGLAESHLVHQFAIGADGSLTPLSPATAAAGNQTISISMTPDGKFVYVTNYGDNTLSQFKVNANGTLTPLAGGNPAG
ncbi:MAG: hypothetical protein JWN14_201 [Chthonomonadales bacterium]|nr:hypothetical protein [Chthonomonadales bacterium]